MASVKKPIKIYARLKPLPSDPFPYEVETVEMDETNDEILVLRMRPQNAPAEDSYYAHAKLADSHRFRYSKVFDRDTEQTEVFDTICKPVLDSALSGYNGTVFAYGQTGSGKTFTMSGCHDKHEQRGIIPRSLSYIFQKFQELDDGTELQGVSITYLEIYNENGYDLLHNGFSGRLEDLRKVLLMEDGNQNIHLKNLSVHPVLSEQDAMRLFYLGEHNRTIAETPMNEASTRSHCIFSIYLNILEPRGSIIRKSKVHLVDLAGSERISNSNISGQLFNEARHINLALHYLEQVIVALGEPNRNHIPYRNSMMTSILKDSLGGNCMTSMIATVSLEPRNIPETLSTCRFSQRVAMVTNDATLNEEVDPDMLIVQLKAEIKRLKQTIANSMIKPIGDDALPITTDELNECWAEVQRYLDDPEESAFLTIQPDMRLVQVCFRCLKYAVSKYGPNQQHTNPSLPAGSEYTLPDMSAEDQDNPLILQLLLLLRNRDDEIRALTESLRKNKGQTPSGGSSARSNPCQAPPLPICMRPQDPEGSPRGTGNPKPFAVVTEQDTLLPEITSNALIEKEVHLLDGFSEEKRVALGNFITCYSGKSKITDARSELMRRRTLLQQIEEDMETTHGNLNQLKRVMNSNVDDESNNNEVFKTHFENQKRNLDLHESRRLNTKKYVDDSENHLKSIYQKLMEDFHAWLNIQSQNGESPITNAATGVIKRSEVLPQGLIPTINDLVGTLKPSPKKTSLGNESSKKKTKKGNRKKKSVENASSARSLDEEEIGSDADMSYSGRVLPRHRSKVPPASPVDSPRSPRPFADRAPVRGEALNDSPLLISSKNDSPNSNKEIKTRESPRSVVGNSSMASARSRNSDEPNSLQFKDLPMTGDPDTDREILNFFRKRQAVFRKLNVEKESQLLQTSTSSFEGVSSP